MKRLYSFASFTVALAGSRRLFRFGCSVFLAYLAWGPAFSAGAQKPSARAPKPDAAALEVKQGKLLYAKNNLAGALASYSKAIELRPDWGVAYVLRGTVRRVQGKLDLAIKDFDKALELDEASMRNNLTVAEAYVNHGNIKKYDLQIGAAIVDYDKAVRLFPTHTQTYLQRGQARLLDDAFDGAIADFDHFITNEKHDPFSKALAYADRSMVKRLRGKTPEADSDLQESLKLMKDKGGEKIIVEHLKEMGAQLEMLRRIRPRRPEKIARRDGRANICATCQPSLI